MKSEKIGLLRKFNMLNKKSVTPTLIIVFAVMICIFYIINPLYITLDNIKSILSNIPIYGILAVGLSFVLLTGNIDISVGSILAIVSIVCARLNSFTDKSIPVLVTILIGVTIGVAIGALNGFFVTIVGLNSIVVTLSTLTIFRSLAYIYGIGGFFIKYKPFLAISKGYLFKYFHINFIYMLIIITFAYIVLRFTKFGNDFYSTGANTFVAKLFGINTRKIQFISFIISGFTAAIAGILLSSQFGWGEANFGSGIEFSILTICILGGVSLMGGRGTLVGVFLAILIIGSINNGLALGNIKIELRSAFEGILLIVAVIFDSIRTKKTKT